MANNVTDAAKEEAIRAAIIAGQEKVLAEVTGHLLKQMWISGLDKNAKEAAKAESSRLKLNDLLRHADQFSSGGHQKQQKKHHSKKVFELEEQEEAEDPEDVNAVKQKKSASTATCYYCQRQGHIERYCIAKRKAEKAQGTKGKGKGASGSSNNSGNAWKEDKKYQDFMRRAYAMYEKEAKPEEASSIHQQDF